MSYAGPAAPRSAKRPLPPRVPAVPRATSSDWRQLAVFGAGLALGIALGAGVALLTAPQDGEQTRDDIRRRARRTRRVLEDRGLDAWIGVRKELRLAKQALLRRKAAAETDDATEAS